MKTSTLRPGLLVSLKTSVRGNVSYSKQVIEAEHRLETGEEKARWEMVRTIVDPDEHEKAKKARSKAASLVRSVCALSAFGLLCPEADAGKLEKALEAARKVVDDFNDDAKLSRVGVYVISGRIAADDVEAVKAINSEIKELLETMAQGVATLDVKAIRDAASRAKEIGQMLSPDAQARVTIAVETAREAAKKIVKAGETAAREVDESAVRKITEQRTAFLDLDDAKEIAAPAVSGLALDLAPAKRNSALDGYQPESRELDVAKE